MKETITLPTKDVIKVLRANYDLLSDETREILRITGVLEEVEV